MIDFEADGQNEIAEKIAMAATDKNINCKQVCKDIITEILDNPWIDEELAQNILVSLADSYGVLHKNSSLEEDEE